MPNHLDFPVDLVVTWVDDNDGTWNKKKKDYINNPSLNNDNRYRDLGVFQYWFKLVEKNLPWVNHIFVITDNQKLPFEVSTDKVIFVNHSDYINKRYLPTFNSNVIEMSLGKLDKLSEHFILSNDDMFFIKPLEKSYFFSKEGKPKDIGVLNILQPKESFTKIPFNNLVFLNKHFNKKSVLKNNFSKIFNFTYGWRNIQTILTLPYSSITGFYEHHQPYAHLKSTFIKLQSEYPNMFDNQFKHRFRTSDDISQWLIREWNILSGNFEPKSPKTGKVITIKQPSDIDDLKSILRKNKNIKTLVINDKEMNSQNFQEVKHKLRTLFADWIDEC